MISLTTIFLSFLLCIIQSQPVGYNTSKVSSYKLIQRSAKSTLYQIQDQGTKDGRPVKLLQLIGTHNQIGYDYGRLLAPQMVYNYNTFLNAQFPKRWEILLFQYFLDWQYENYVRLEIPMQFIDEIWGIRKGGMSKNFNNLHLIVQRILVVSSYAGNIQKNIMYALIDQFKRSLTPKLVPFGIMQLFNNNLSYFVDFSTQFINQRRIHCSFFATWGSRTVDGKLFTMRNLDWQANTGMNANKIIFVYKIDNTIPHLTLGFPGVLGALTGMSAAGITVHQAGLDSKKQSQIGFQWTLRLRYVMMHAKNLKEAQLIWRSTNNTLGINHMIASAADVKYAHAALVLQTMGGYTAYFRDFDIREQNTTFVDPVTKQNYRGGFSMRQAVFRTNHGYDSKIQKNLLVPHQQQKSSTIIRYKLLKDSFIWYQQQNILIDQNSALNITAILGNKGSKTTFKVCPNQPIGTNVISVMFAATDLKMWASFQYSTGQTYRPACCAVYLQIDMRKWFGLAQDYQVL